MEIAAAFIEKMIREVTTGKRAAVPGLVLGCVLSVLAVAAAAQTLSAGSAAETEMPVAPPPAVSQPAEPSPSPSPAPEEQAPSPAPDVAVPAPIPSDGSAIRARFGAPDFVRREMDNELWRYDANGCSVFFFLQRRGATLELRYTETLPRGMDMPANPVCVASLEQRMARMPDEVIGSPAVPP